MPTPKPRPRPGKIPKKRRQQEKVAETHNSVTRKKMRIFINERKKEKYKKGIGDWIEEE